MPIMHPIKRISILRPVGSRVAARAHHKILERQRDLSTSQGSACVSPVFAYKLYQKNTYYVYYTPSYNSNGRKRFLSFLHQLQYFSTTSGSWSENQALSDSSVISVIIHSFKARLLCRSLSGLAKCKKGKFALVDSLQTLK